MRVQGRYKRTKATVSQIGAIIKPIAKCLGTLNHILLTFLWPKCVGHIY